MLFNRTNQPQKRSKDKTVPIRTADKFISSRNARTKSKIGEQIDLNLNFSKINNSEKRQNQLRTQQISPIKIVNFDCLNERSMESDEINSETLEVNINQVI